jgi:WD40 repeat protein
MPGAWSTRTGRPAARWPASRSPAGGPTRKRPAPARPGTRPRTPWPAVSTNSPGHWESLENWAADGGFWSYWRKPRDFAAGGGKSGAELRGVLPSRADLRSEAVAAALLPDARMLWKLRSQFGAQPGLGADGNLAVTLWISADSKKSGVVLTDASDRRELGRWENEGIAGSAFALSRDGKMLASVGAETGVVALWDLPAGKRITTLRWPEPPGAADRPTAPGLLMSSEMAFSPDGRYLTAVHRAPLPKDFDLAELTEIFSSPITEENRRNMEQFLGEMIQTIVLWDLQQGAEPRPLVTAIKDTNRGGAVFSSDGRFLAFPAGQRTVTLWSLESGRKSADLQLPLPLVGRVAFDRSGQRLACPCSSSAASRGALLIWDVAGNAEQSRLETDFALTASLPAFSPGGDQLALGTSSGRVVLFDLTRRQEMVRLRAAHAGMVALLRWDGDGRHLLSWGVEGQLKRWELGNRPASNVRTGQEAFGFALSPDGQWLAAGGGPEGKVQLIDRARGSVVRTLSGYGFPLPGLLLFSAEGRQLAQVGAYQTVVWDVTTGQEIARLEESNGLAGRIVSVAFAGDGSLRVSVAGTKEPRLAVWDVTRRREIWRAANGGLHTGYLTPDGRLLAALPAASSAGSGKMTVLEIPSGQTVARSELPGAPFGPQSFSPDGRWLVTSNVQPSAHLLGLLQEDSTRQTDLGLILQAFPTGEKRLRVVGPAAPSAYAFSPDGGLLAIGYRDGSAGLWDVAGGEEIFRGNFCSQPVAQLAFTPDGVSLAVTDGKSPIQLLHLAGLRRQLAEVGLGW